jgi:hypothetical protein
MDEPVEVDDGRIRVYVRQRNRGHGTGIWVDQDPYFHDWTLAGGKVTKLEFGYVRPD